MTNPKTYNLYQKTKPYRNKTYVAFDADSDIRYYRLMKAWKQSENSEFNFLNSDDLRIFAIRQKKQQEKS